MSLTFNSSELIEMAEKIEEDGQNFCRKASELFDNPHIQDLLIKLANWENKNKTRFAKLREEIQGVDQQVSNIESEVDLSLYLQAMEGLYVFTAKENSIVYFLALKAFVPTETGEKKIDDIIKEELRHIAILNKSIKECI